MGGCIFLELDAEPVGALGGGGHLPDAGDDMEEEGAPIEVEGDVPEMQQAILLSLQPEDDIPEQGAPAPGSPLRCMRPGLTTPPRRKAQQKALW